MATGPSVFIERVEQSYQLHRFVPGQNPESLADIGQYLVQSSSVLPEQPGKGLVQRQAPGLQALPVQTFALQWPEPRLTTGVDLAVAATTHRSCCDGLAGC